MKHANNVKALAGLSGCQVRDVMSKGIEVLHIMNKTSLVNLLFPKIEVRNRIFHPYNCRFGKLSERKLHRARGMLYK